MKVKELMKDITIIPEFTGWVTNDDYVLAINTTPNTDSVKEEDYEVLQIGVAGLDSQMNPITKDNTYIRAGQSTTKTGTQRAFKVQEIDILVMLLKTISVSYTHLRAHET